MGCGCKDWLAERGGAPAPRVARGADQSRSSVDEAEILSAASLAVHQNAAAAAAADEQTAGLQEAGVLAASGALCVMVCFEPPVVRVVVKAIEQNHPSNMTRRPGEALTNHWPRQSFLCKSPNAGPLQHTLTPCPLHHTTRS